MGKFNPNAPIIQGMEFVPLADSVRPLDTGTEIGYSFTVTGAPGDAVTSVEFLPFIPASQLSGQTVFYSIYPRGREDDVGQVNVVRWIADTVFVTGATVSGVSAQAAISQAADSTFIEFDALTDRLRATFAAPFSLSGKRILGVDLVYQAAGSPGFALEPSIESNTVIYPYGPYITGPPTLTQVAQLGTVRFGEVNPWWSTSAGPNTSSTRGNWRYTDMQRWSQSSLSQLYIGIRPSTIPIGGRCQLGYLAVDVYYCEESRVACGGTAFGQDSTGLLTFTSDIASTPPPVRDPLTQTTPVTLAAGDYTVTVTIADAGDKFNAGDKIAVPQLFQQQQLATHPTVEIMKFQRPISGRAALIPLSAPTDYMVAAVPLCDIGALQFGAAPVPYITSEGAPVYRTSAGNNIDASQQIHNTGLSPGRTYPWVRFYARRFNPSSPGDLLLTYTGGNTLLTAAAFLEYPEIVLGTNGAGTGWREITLRLTTDAQYTHDYGFGTITFSMTNVAKSSAADQYQILTTRVFTPVETSGRAPADSAASSFYQKSRYDGYQNATMTWQAPEVVGSTTATDSNSTAVVMFSVEAAAPTGLAVAQLSQEITGIALDCSTVPQCIPTGISYNQVTWGSNLVVCDTYSRVASTWTDADTGQTWVLNIPGDFSENGTRGLVSLSSLASNRRASIGEGFADGRVTALVKPGVVASGAPVIITVAGRRNSATNTNYLAEISYGTGVTSGTPTLSIRRNLAGILTTLASYTLPSYTDDTEHYISLQYTGFYLQAKAWDATSPEPLTWQIETTDTSITAAGQTGFSFMLSAGNTNALPVIVEADNFVSVPLDLVEDAYWELQRMDELDDDWQTIATVPVCTLTVNDYEARVGIESEYRLRAVNTSEFQGAWSSTVATTLTSPGVAGAGDGNSVLLFTSNLGPTGNLAYVMNWDGDVSEDFAFPESGQTQTRAQYQRDFVSSYHGTERGGETFSRMLLVQAAAIPPISMANFRSLRDLAWADLPYICVRDELGNRWFAFVQVPSGRVRRNRRLYYADIVITQSTETPAPVVT